MKSLRSNENQHWEDLGHSAYPVSSNGWSLIALEAWRRGLDVTFKRGGRYSVSSDTTVWDFKLSRTATASARETVRIVNDKRLAKSHFEAHGVPAPSGRSYDSPFNYGAILRDATELGYPVVLKAANWSKGKGVFVGLQDESEIESALHQLDSELNAKRIMLEELIAGDDVRAYVVGDRVVAATLRVPANVTGDGTSTVRELIDVKNNLRSKNPYLKGALIVPDEEVERLLSRQQLNLDSVPPKEQIVQLRSKANASAGGDSIDITEVLSEKTATVAVDAVKAIPGLHHGGVDLLVDDFMTPSETATVIEINAAAELGIHLYPSYGKARRPDIALIDFYFPTSRRRADRNFLYPNLKAINRLLVSSASAVKLPPCPESSQYYECRLGPVNNPRRLAKRIRNIAQRYDVNGKLSLGAEGGRGLVTGSEDSIKRFFSELAAQGITIAAPTETRPAKLTLGIQIEWT